MPTNTQKPKKITTRAKLHQLLRDYQHTHLSTAELQQLGIFSPAAQIASLKAEGVTIHTIYQSITDADGTIHPGVAHYKMIDEVSP